MALEQRRRRRPCSSPWARPSTDAACAALYDGYDCLRPPLRSPATSRQRVGDCAGSSRHAIGDQDHLALRRAAQQWLQQLHAGEGRGRDGSSWDLRVGLGSHARRGAGGCDEHPPNRSLSMEGHSHAGTMGGSTEHWLHNAIDGRACSGRALWAVCVSWSAHLCDTIEHLSCPTVSCAKIDF